MVLVRTAASLCFDQKHEKYQNFHIFFFCFFCAGNVSVYLNRYVFIMRKTYFYNLIVIAPGK